MTKPGLHCDFRTGQVHVSPLAFEHPAQALAWLASLSREVARFQLALNEGIKTQADYRVWAAAEEAPPTLAMVGR